MLKFEDIEDKFCEMKEQCEKKRRRRYPLSVFEDAVGEYERAL